MSDAYDMIDRFLRNNLGDDDYAEYSEALDSLCSAQPAQADNLLVKRAEWDALSTDARQLLNAAARAQPAPITSESGNQAAQGASAITSGSVPLLSQAEICDLLDDAQVPDMPDGYTGLDMRIARIVEKAVRSKLGAGVGWQAIETAPKDGTEVLAWREDCGQFIALYTSPDSFPMTQYEIDLCDESLLFSKDWFTQWPQSIRLEGSEMPTHWQPLPPPPGNVGKEGGNV